MATQKQWTSKFSAGETVAEERVGTRLRLRIEALEPRIAPSTSGGDDPIWGGFEDPPSGDLDPGLDPGTPPDLPPGP
jgi:hypothetical protein